MTFYPALKYRFLTPVYDPIIKIVVPEKRIKQQVIDLAEPQTGDKILDFGCGTGTLCQMLKIQNHDIDITGIDVDPEILEIARKKAPELAFTSFDGSTLPFKTNSFDKIISTWVFHHLNHEQKIMAFREICRVLKPNGRFVLADWTIPQGMGQDFLFFITCMLDNFQTFKDNKEGKLPELMRKEGFHNLQEKGISKTALGTLGYWIAFK